MSQPRSTERLIEPTYKLSGDEARSQPRVPSLPRFSQATVQQVKRRWPAIAAMVAYSMPRCTWRFQMPPSSYGTLWSMPAATTAAGSESRTLMRSLGMQLLSGF